jgi:hypothetical protein
MAQQSRQQATARDADELHLMSTLRQRALRGALAPGRRAKAENRARTRACSGSGRTVAPASCRLDPGSRDVASA